MILSRRPDFPFELPRIGTASGLRLAFARPAGARAVDPGRRFDRGVIALFKGPKREPAARQVHIRPLSQGPVMDRRSFLGTVAALTPPVLSLSVTGIAMTQLEEFRVRRLRSAIANLPAALDGATIAHVSDMHVGRFTTGSVLRTMIAAVNDLRADIILMTGDLINSSLDELPEAVATVRQFSAPAGVYTIEGNHDLFDGREEFERRVKASGLALLVNETADMTLRGHPVNSARPALGRTRHCRRATALQRRGQPHFIEPTAGAEKSGSVPHSARPSSACV